MALHVERNRHGALRAHRGITLTNTVLKTPSYRTWDLPCTVLYGSVNNFQSICAVWRLTCASTNKQTTGAPSRNRGGVSSRAERLRSAPRAEEPQTTVCLGGEGGLCHHPSPFIKRQFPVWFTEGRAEKVPVNRTPGFEVAARRGSAGCGTLHSVRIYGAAWCREMRPL